MHNDDSIAGRTQTLRQDLEVLLQEEWLYRRSRTRSQAEKADHDKRKIRLVAIREELRLLVEKANQQSTHGAVWYS
jgi:predicted NUDIX family phosphoesterase